MAKKKKGEKKAAKAEKKAAKAAKEAAKLVAKKAPKKAAAKPEQASPTHNPWSAYATNLDRESKITLKVMRAFPADQAGFQPHLRSGTAMQLFWTFAIEQKLALDAIKGTLTMPPSFPPPPATLGECITIFENRVAEVVAAARSAKAASYDRALPMFTGPGTMGEVPAGQIAKLMYLDQIHHRGQLSVYLRLAGGKVPSIYGPSADEPWS